LDIENARVVRKFTEHEEDVVSVDNKDSNVFATGSCDKSAKIWDLRLDSSSSCIFTFKGHDDDINSLAWMLNRDSICTGSADQHIHLYDLRYRSSDRAKIFAVIHTIFA
jgi:guanine nucleotide-binding protein G(I)/G(S)/G(T) subunit beta-1